MGHRNVAVRESRPAIAEEKTSPSPAFRKGGLGRFEIHFFITLKNTSFPLCSQENWQAKESA
jgi:hypothetical protein